MIRLRKVLVSVLHQRTITDESLVTVLCEAEAILNNQPITKVSEDSIDLETLTPKHLLTLKGMMQFGFILEKMVLPTHKGSDVPMLQKSAFSSQHKRT